MQAPTLAMTFNAEYKCLSCNAEWEQPLGPSVAIRNDPNHSFIQPNSPPEYCPGCGHKYMKWLNAKE